MKIRPYQELLPWLTPVTDGLVACKDSGLLASFEFVGIDTDGAQPGQLRQLIAVMDTAMSTLRDQPVSIWWTVVRQRTEDYPGAPMPDPISKLIDDEHRKTFTDSASYLNRYFVSFLWMPPSSRHKASRFSRIGDRMESYISDGTNPVLALLKASKSLVSNQEAFAWSAMELEHAIREFESKLEQVEGALNLISARRLKTDSFWGFLWGMANPGLKMVPKSWNGRAYLDSYLCERPLQPYREVLAADPESKDAHYVSTISFKDWPDVTQTGDFNGLLSLPTELIYSVCFRVASKDEAQEDLDHAVSISNLTKYPLKTVIASALKRGAPDESRADPAKQEAINEATVAVGEMSAGRLYFGWINVTLALMDKDPKKLEETARGALRRFHGSRYVGAVKESINLLSSYASVLPGQWDENKRWHMLSCNNLVDLAPLVSVIPGERWNDHLSAQLGKRQPALTVLGTDYKTPYYFNFHEGALGHAFVVGPSRSGKSAGMNFLMSQYRKYPNARVIIFDRDKSCRIPTLLQGGEHIDARPGGRMRTNPLVLVKDRQHWSFLAAWIGGLIGARGYNVTADDAQEIWNAIESLSVDTNLDNCRLLTIYTLVNTKLQAHLRPWVENGEFGEFFDHVEDSLDISDFVCIEMGDVMKMPMVARALMDYLFYRIELIIRPKNDEPMRPTLVYVEESSFLMQDANFGKRIEGWLKTFAKLLAQIVLTTQSPEDYIEGVASRVWAAIRDNIPTRVYLPNGRALNQDLFELYKSTFQLTPEQIVRIAKATPKQDYLIVKSDVARMVKMRLSQKVVDIVRSDNAAQRIFDEHYRDGKGLSTWQSDYLVAMDKFNKKATEIQEQEEVTA